MTNKEIISQLRLTASLLEFNQADQAKIKAYANAVFRIEQAQDSLQEMDESQIRALGFSKSMAADLLQLAQDDSFPALDNLVDQTPKGILELLNLKGIGAKKVRTIWDELGIESLKSLLEACQAGKIAKLKGFGEKTQAQLIQQILFHRDNANKRHYAEVAPQALKLEAELKELFPKVSLAGEFRMQRGVVTRIRLVVAANDLAEAHRKLSAIEGIREEPHKSSPYCWRGMLDELNIRIAIHITKPELFFTTLFLYSAKPTHLSLSHQGKTLREHVQHQPFESEEAIYESFGLPYIIPPLREGTFEWEAAKAGKLPKLVQMEDLRGILHNHSTYSDGRHSLRQMAIGCRDLGYEYLGITDHSVSAFYAGGLSEANIRQQHQEIDQLNEELAPFTIFKGIESDILGDGSLDYPDEVLDSFDFIISSIHSNLRMDRAKATERLIKAIANPYTTTLGHPTGRLLLKRKGYPIDHQAVIRACAQHGVSIEVNANPWRLDLDWRWVHEAIRQGVKISINPDAHDLDHYRYMRFGLLIAQKGGLTADMTLNAMSREELAAHFAERKARARKLTGMLVE